MFTALAIQGLQKDIRKQNGSIINANPPRPQYYYNSDQEKSKINI